MSGKKTKCVAFNGALAIVAAGVLIGAVGVTASADHCSSDSSECPTMKHHKAMQLLPMVEERSDCPSARGGHGGSQSAAHESPLLQLIDAGCYGMIWGFAPPEEPICTPPLAPRVDYRAELFRMTECPQAPVGDHFTGFDHLVSLMGYHGLKFFQSGHTTLDAGPDGVVATDDVIVVKINYQWPERGGTNTDLLRGMLRRIFDHPDGFTGEVVVCENTQFAAIQNFDRSENNAEDHSLSPHDVVVAFQGDGHRVSHYSWTAIKAVGVSEYSEGSSKDGYVTYDYDPDLHGKISYPKFETEYGTFISLKYGLWDPDAETYDRDHLKFINAPLLKSHHATYGATCCVKHYMGVVTDSLGTSSHSAIRYGILGAQMAEIQLADLNILDCIWINANPYDGPWTTYEGATRRDQLIASLDPVAIDIWAVKNILIPAFIETGYSPPWPYPSADPDDPTSMFRQYLDNSMAWILAAGYDATNDLDQIDMYTFSGTGDIDEDGVIDGEDNCPYHYNPPQLDCDEDGIGDLCAIAEGLSLDCDENGIPDECECLMDFDGDGFVNVLDLIEVLSAWGDAGGGSPQDLNCDGVVDVMDLISVLAAWGPCL